MIELLSGFLKVLQNLSEKKKVEINVSIFIYECCIFHMHYSYTKPMSAYNMGYIMLYSADKADEMRPLLLFSLKSNGEDRHIKR